MLYADSRSVFTYEYCVDDSSEFIFDIGGAGGGEGGSIHERSMWRLGCASCPWLLATRDCCTAADTDSKVSPPAGSAADLRRPGRSIWWHHHPCRTFYAFPAPYRCRNIRNVEHFMSVSCMQTTYVFPFVVHMRVLQSIL